MTNQLARSLLLPLAVLATLVMAATAVASPGTAAAQQADDGAPAPLNAPTVPKYFPGIGGGPYSFALEAAYATAYGAAADEGYPAATCRLSAGPVAHQINQTYFQVMLEICCTPPAGAGAGVIIGVDSGRCIDVRGGTAREGTPVQLYDCSGTDAQRWGFHSDGTVRAMGHCMDVQRAHTANNTYVGLNRYHGADNQRWERLPNGSLRSVHSGKCPDAPRFGTHNGHHLVIRDGNGAANQLWRGPAMES
ncbi:ricin-type beta-trefoil lectin domain protein [Streptomyces bohaiensis]|uniref:ricin-type beta-trefoil lectin domain protein n=1 Tax=Streptomyces bohaiensis TaxID=1431344 RepID=UPI003B7A9877